MITALHPTVANDRLVWAIGQTATVSTKLAIIKENIASDLN